MESNHEAEHWIRLVEAVKSYMRDYDAGFLPYIKRGNEATFQASLFHELVKNHDYPDVELEKNVDGMRPDLVLGRDKIMCEIKTTAGEKRIVKDIEKTMKYLEIASISVVIMNCQKSASELIKSYLDNNNYKELSQDILNMLPNEKSYCILPFSIDRCIYLIINIRK